MAAVDLSVTLGDIMTVGAFIATALIAYGATKNSVKNLVTSTGEFAERTEAQFDDVKVELKKIGEVMIALAENKGRMDRMDDRAIMQGGRIDENTRQVNTLRDEVTALKLQMTALQRST